MLVVDASVWVAAGDRSDPFCRQSRAFLVEVARRRMPVLLPAIARVEVACALARRLRDPAGARMLTEELMHGPMVRELPVGARLLARAVEEGTALFLRGPDALYVAAARMEQAEIVSWDAEHIRRAGARTPQAWLQESN
ncbi:MAG: type II toxin-antitoxin system VapC family toxin [Armatimonadota bacterium]|nr:type II toxin-antitoxin system VapC family toxin [Armatimonadota bacterium]MDR5689642.1 type II toxin-antitoxin system VapC family toxin [Armatimonadota bacterium]MDR7392652.1 type II toxin-antitoxin system VapC family toxin [Armatimonadota bacterium]MDR7397661.1 type II toxin-antitoxin system VapC family toxin [Armatimonadota bacterium]MDR7429684.1 type II toxin-antitoxin system VapC family toxin [Armatimonadota bacterium]